VYLRVSPEVALERMGAAVSTRPLLNRRNPIGELRRLYAEREQYYMSADLYVDTELLDLAALTDLICSYVRATEQV
jgi:shikimate kinase